MEEEDHKLFHYILLLFFPLVLYYLVSLPCSERWVLHSTMEYAQGVISETGLQKPSEETLTRVSEELFEELRSRGVITSQPFHKKALRQNFPRDVLFDL